MVPLAAQIYAAIREATGEYETQDIRCEFWDRPQL
jgi:hypothetical protein